jgi:hypothetical protein
MSVAISNNLDGVQHRYDSRSLESCPDTARGSYHAESFPIVAFQDWSWYIGGPQFSDQHRMTTLDSGRLLSMADQQATSLYKP